MLTCLIIDDEPLAREGLSEYVQKVDFLNLHATCESAYDSLGYLAEGKIDLIFLDIQMPGLNGIDFLKSLRKAPLSILTTAYPSYALEGYQLDVVDYLVKPITFERFLKAAHKAHDFHKMTHQPPAYQPLQKARKDHFFIKCDHKFEKIRIDDIVYIEGLQNYISIHTVHRKYITLVSMKQIQQQLPGEDFIRVHKSYIVARDRIDSVKVNEIRIGKNEIPLSRTYKEAVLASVVGGNLVSR